MFCLLWPTDILYTALAKMSWVYKMSKSPESHKLPPVTHSCPAELHELQVHCGLLATVELQDFYLSPPTHRGDSSSHKKKIPHCPGESLPIEPFPGSSELTWMKRKHPRRRCGESDLGGSMWTNHINGVGQVYTWCLLPRTNQAQLL